ncbi:FMRFamide receptor-like [Physella acuta]|uniref:FMRFamide receptor-like n=1 Tax=Physella acuta TaxID=109671 RepID=UPI0027DDA2F6|nr:FMRFamide receptor-like [Physella acuta]
MNSTQLDRTNIANDLGPLSTDSTKLLNVFFYIDYVIMPILSASGIIGNILTLIVLFQYGFKESFNVLLTSLAIADLVYSFTVLAISMDHFVTDQTSRELLEAVISAHLYPLNEVAYNTSAFIIAALSLQRMIVVWFPFKASFIFTPFRTLVIVISINLAMFLLYSPRCFRWILLPVDSSTNKNDSMYVVQHDIYFYDNDSDYVLSSTIIKFLSLMVIAPSIISVCSFITIAKIITSSDIVKKMSKTFYRKRLNETKLEIMNLSICSCIVFLTVIPTTMNPEVFYFRGPRKTPPLATLLLYNDLVPFLMQINASIHFLIYVTYSSKFLKIFQRTITCGINS